MSAEKMQPYRVVPLKNLSLLVPGTTVNFWHQRSRLGKIPGQIRCGGKVLVNLDVFEPAFFGGEIEPLRREEDALAEK